MAGPVLAAKTRCEAAVVLSTPHASQCNWLFHAIPQHLIGCDKHDANDESHSEGADQAFPDTCLTIFLLGMN